MIRLYKNNAYQWFEEDGVYTIGYGFYQDKLYTDRDLTKLIIRLRENIVNEINKITGYFAIVIQNREETTLISDIIRSFPLFYDENGNVTDDIELLRGELNELSLKELLHTRWVSCDDTIYQKVKQLENAQIVKIKDKKILKQKYFEYKYHYNETYSFEELDEVFQNMTQKMIRYLNGKTAVVPLSGGHDSRLLLYYLKQNNYNKIITYTYGNKNGGEVEVSRKVAEFLKVPWYFVEYEKKSCKRKYNNKKSFSDMAKYFGRGYSSPHIQEWEAIDVLIKKKIVDCNNSVVIPGFTLDFLTGSHLYPEYIENEMLSKNKINEKIYDNNYNLTKKDNSIFDNKLEKKFRIHFNEEYIKAKEVANLHEKYDFEERQTKFITNAVRTYDYYGLKWYLPIWDKEVINFWNKVSLNDRYQRKYFIDFVYYKYKDLMEYAPVYKKKEGKKLNLLQKIWCVFSIYNNDPINFYYYFKFTEYLKYVITEKNFSYDYYIANDYVRYLRRNHKNGV